MAQPRPRKKLARMPMLVVSIPISEFIDTVKTMKHYGNYCMRNLTLITAMHEPRYVHHDSVRPTSCSSIRHGSRSVTPTCIHDPYI